MLDLSTEDCFAGRVRSASDLVSRLNIAGLNPRTGPFWIEGAERMPKRYPPKTAYSGVHANLSSLAASL